MRFTRMYFSDFLVERKGLLEPNDDEIQELTKIEKIDFSEGRLHLGKYKPTKTKQLIVEPNDFVFSGLNIEKGAVSINSTGSRLVVSANYSTCEINFNVIDKEFLSYLIKSQYFKSILIDHLKKDYGFTRPKHLMPLSFIAPSSINDQRQIVEQLKRTAVEGLELKFELTHQQTLLKKLRQQILQEAIEGKLTADWRAQNPDVEPASELLGRIAAEKAQRVKDKKIKAQKPLPPITDEEKPFELPQRWEWMKVEHFLKYDRRGMITGPFGSALQKSEHQAAGVPVWGIESIKNGRFTHKNKIFVTVKKAMELRSFAAAPGDLIISRSGTIDEICVIPNNVESGLISTNLLRVSILAQIVNPQYFCFQFKGCVSVLDQLKELCSGSTRLFLNQNILKSLLFPVPPISEQEVIVAKVEKLLALCDQLETQITQNQTHAEQLMQAVLREAFSHNSEAEPAAATPIASIHLSAGAHNA